MSLVTEARRRMVPALGAVEGEAVAARLQLRESELTAALAQLYGASLDVSDLVSRLTDQVLDTACARPEPLRVLDRRREVDPSWFQGPATIGYVCYADRFADGLRGVRRRLDYLGELGVTHLQLMPLLRTRDGDNDGGYAVLDYYGSVDPRLGTMGDLEDLAVDLHTRDMALCIDLVLNHTAAEHPWARAAPAGDPAYRPSTACSPTGRCPTASNGRCRRCSPTRRPGRSPASTISAGSGRPSTTISGTSTGPTRPCSRRC